MNTKISWTIPNKQLSQFSGGEKNTKAKKNALTNPKNLYPESFLGNLSMKR